MENSLFGSAAVATVTRPLDALKRDGTLQEFVPDINSRPALGQFLTNFLLRNDSKEERAIREEARQTAISSIKRDESHDNTPIKLFVFDIDHTIALLYPISSSTGHWAMGRLAKQHGLDENKVYEEARKMPPEFLCHSPHEFMGLLSKATGIKELDPELPANAQVMKDWRDATDVLTQQLVYKSIQEGVQKIKQAGNLVYIATNGPPANVFHRMHLWFKGQDQLFDGIAVRETLPGMAAENRFAGPAEKAFVQRLKDDNKIMIIPEPDIKPSGKHLLTVLEHANANQAKNGKPGIAPRETVLIGDSFGSDGGAARDLARFTGGESAQFAWLGRSMVTDKEVIRMHQEAANPIDVLGLIPVLEKVKNNKTNGPHYLVDDFRHFLDQKLPMAAMRPKDVPTAQQSAVACFG